MSFFLNAKNDAKRRKSATVIAIFKRELALIKPLIIVN